MLGGRVMGSSDSGSGNGHDIDKKIQVALPRAQQSANPRSRKASEVFGVFKGTDFARGQTKLNQVPEGHAPAVIEDHGEEQQDRSRKVHGQRILDPGMFFHTL